MPWSRVLLCQLGHVFACYWGAVFQALVITTGYDRRRIVVREQRLIKRRRALRDAVDHRTFLILSDEQIVGRETYLRRIHHLAERDALADEFLVRAAPDEGGRLAAEFEREDRKSTRLNSSH